MSKKKGKASTQIALDDDFNVPDMKPDVLHLIQNQAEIKITETNIGQGHIWIKGVLCFQLLYRSDMETPKLDCLFGELSFQETIAFDEITPQDKLKVQWQIEDLTTGMIHSRKLSIRALVEVTVVVTQDYQQEFVTGIQAEENIQILEKTRSMMELLQNKKDTYRLKEEITLPSNKPNIQEILWKSVQLRGVEYKLGEDRISIKGEAFVFVLYVGEEEENRLQWFETALPFSGTMECNGCKEEMIGDISHILANVVLEARPDYDGEERMLSLELVLELDLQIYQEEELLLLEDIYGMNCQLELSQEPVSFETLLLKNFSKCKVSNYVSVGENQVGILQICAGEGNVCVEKSEIIPDGIQVERTLCVKILYITSDDKNPLSSLNTMIPFHYTIEVAGITSDARYQIEACIEQLSTAMLDSMQVEVKSVLNLNTMVFQEHQMERLTDVKVYPLDMQELQARPGMVGYIGREGESLWEIAKENHTTIEKIQETNQLTKDTLSQGEKILIIKTVNAL